MRSCKSQPPYRKAGYMPENTVPDFMLGYKDALVGAAFEDKVMENIYPTVEAAAETIQLDGEDPESVVGRLKFAEFAVSLEILRSVLDIYDDAPVDPDRSLQQEFVQELMKVFVQDMAPLLHVYLIQFLQLKGEELGPLEEVYGPLERAEIEDALAGDDVESAVMGLLNEAGLL